MIVVEKWINSREVYDSLEAIVIEDYDDFVDDERGGSLSLYRHCVFL